MSRFYARRLYYDAPVCKRRWCWRCFRTWLDYWLAVPAPIRCVSAGEEWNKKP